MYIELLKIDLGPNISCHFKSLCKAVFDGLFRRFDNMVDK